MRGTTDATSRAAAVGGGLSRRRLIGGGAALSLGAMAGPAAAFVGGGHVVRTFRGRYAIDSHRVVDGVLATPKGRERHDVVVVYARPGTAHAAVEAEAQRHAAAGRVAIAPDLGRTYPTAAALGHAAAVAALTADLPRYKRLGRKAGQLSVVAV
jgi:hypothetical protein